MKNDYEIAFTEKAQQLEEIRKELSKFDNMAEMDRLSCAEFAETLAREKLAIKQFDLLREQAHPSAANHATIIQDLMLDVDKAQKYLDESKAIFRR